MWLKSCLTEDDWSFGWFESAPPECHFGGGGVLTPQIWQQAQHVPTRASSGTRLRIHPHGINTSHPPSSGRSLYW